MTDVHRGSAGRLMALTALFKNLIFIKHGYLEKTQSNSSPLDKFGSFSCLLYPMSLLLSSPIFMLPNMKIFLESEDTGGIWRQNMHLSIQNA